jgi:tetratricopeptide (TPR) repeat protein
MKHLTSLMALCVLLGAPLAAQSQVPERGLTAEAEGRWSDALQIYEAELERNPALADIWIRVADIDARLGRTEDAIAALERASAVNPGAAPVLARLSQAYAAAGHAQAALHAIEGAIALQPDVDEYIRAHATLATWAGDYSGAAASYRKLRQQHPGDAELVLALARVTVWAGSTDAAVASYREYLSLPHASPEVWLELARAESWRGNFAGALATLDEYRREVGETPAYSRELAATLARGGRPREALRHLDTLLAGSPADYELNLSRTIALASLQRQRDAYSSLTTTDTLNPGRAETHAAQAFLQSLLASKVGSSGNVYSDSDGLRTFRAAPRFDIGFGQDTRVQGGYEFADLVARTGSGLEQASGATEATVEHVWSGLTQRVGALTLGGTLGQAWTGSQRLTTYSALLRFAPSDVLSAAIERTFGFSTISPRTVGLGLTRSTDRVQLDWFPGLRYHVAVDASHEDLSDGNTRWEVFAAPSIVVARQQRLNMDIGFLVHQFGARYDFDNGYYDPKRYESYSLVLSPYWKVSENVGLAISAGFGGQRDDSSSTFRFGSQASAEATFGIYGRWVLKVNGATTTNRRLDSGAFRGYSAGAVLLRRF